MLEVDGRITIQRFRTEICCIVRCNNICYISTAFSRVSVYNSVACAFCIKMCTVTKMTLLNRYYFCVDCRSTRDLTRFVSCIIYFFDF